MRTSIALIFYLAILISSFNILANTTHEFEGRYQVGNTICTVKPVKMAFEVRWIRGKGVMIFFFDRETEDGKFIFSSHDGVSSQDKFEFDNKELISGRFVRSDGIIFPVRKLHDNK